MRAGRLHPCGKGDDLRRRGCVEYPSFSLLGTLLGQWQTDQHPGAALWGTLDYATAAQFRCSLSHRGEAHPRATLRWDAHAVVADLQPHFLIDCKTPDAAVCLGMTRDVG